jgi:hypothetical protein
MVAIALATGPALANTIDFSGENGGTVSYAGGSSGLVGAGLPISSVFGTPPGSGSSIGVVGGSMSFATGGWTGGMNLGGGQFLSFFSPGGSILITGTVPTAGITTSSTLLQGTFSGVPIFQYSGAGLASLNGSLSLTVLNSALSSYFNFAPLTGSEPGVIAQADFGISFVGGIPGIGIAFSGSQSSVNVAVNAANPVSVPEGDSLMLVASGLVAVGLVRLGLTGKRKLIAA